MKIRPIHFIAVILALLLLLLFQCNSMSVLKEKNNALENKVDRINGNVEASKDTIESFRNKNGYYMSEIKGYQYTIEELKDSNSDILKKYKDALNEAVELERINQVLQAQLEIKDVDTV